MPSDAAEQYRAAVATRDQALRDLAREQARIQGEGTGLGVVCE